MKREPFEQLGFEDGVDDEGREAEEPQESGNAPEANSFDEEDKRSKGFIAGLNVKGKKFRERGEQSRSMGK